MYKKYVKRIIDVFVSLSVLVLLSPILLVLYFLVRIDLGKPVLFRHQRPGKGEKIFTLYKFRSMTDAKDTKGDLLPDEERLTRLGRVLRSSSLDELPELLNILKGDMSIVGPRPLEVYFLPFYNERERHRHDVRPGLTGLAQVNGRNNLSWDQRFEYDIEYMNKISFFNDLKIVFQTVAKVLNGEGTGIPLEDFNVVRQTQRDQSQVPTKPSSE